MKTVKIVKRYGTSLIVRFDLDDRKIFNIKEGDKLIMDIENLKDLNKEETN